jgi:hypothetical protein
MVESARQADEYPNPQAARSLFDSPVDEGDDAAWDPNDTVYE